MTADTKSADLNLAATTARELAATIVGRSHSEANIAREEELHGLARRLEVEARVDTTYNGWTNYATWGVALVLHNDQGTHEEVREQAAAFAAGAADHENVAEGIWTAESAARFGLSDWLADFTRELCGLEDCDGTREPSMMAMQVIGAGLADVDWDAIARNILSELEG